MRGNTSSLQNSEGPRDAEKGDNYLQILLIGQDKEAMMNIRTYFFTLVVLSCRDSLLDAASGACRGFRSICINSQEKTPHTAAWYYHISSRSEGP